MKLINVKIIEVFLLVFVLTMGFHVKAQVGIGTENPSTMLDVNGAISFRDGNLLPLDNGANGIVKLGANPSSFYTITGPTADFSISGFSHVPGENSHFMFLQNGTDYNMTLLNNPLNSSDPNPNDLLYIANNQNITIPGKNAIVTFQYVKLAPGVDRWWFPGGLDLINILEYTPDSTEGVPAQGSKTYVVHIPGSFPEPPGSRRIAGIAISIIGPTSASLKEDITIEYAEARDQEIYFRVSNSSSVNAYDNIKYRISINH